MKIVHHESSSGQHWTISGTEACILYSPSEKSGVADPYLFARTGEQQFSCYDKEGFVHSFRSLLDKESRAPAYMKRLARRAQSDLEIERALMIDNDPPCESCGEPVSENEDCGNERPDGTWEFLCPDCYEPSE